MLRRLCNYEEAVILKAANCDLASIMAALKKRSGQTTSLLLQIAIPAEGKIWYWCQYMRCKMSPSVLHQGTRVVATASYASNEHSMYKHTSHTVL